MSQVLEGIVKDHSNEIFGYLCRYLGNSSAAEDILGEVYVRLIEQYRRTQEDEFQWRPWLYRVATNLAISSLRRKKIASIFRRSHEAEPDHSHQEHRGMDDEQRDVKIRAAVETLGKRHKAVVLMRYYQDMSHEEISSALDINIGTVKSRLNEARRRLGIMLSEVEI